MRPQVMLPAMVFGLALCGCATHEVPQDVLATAHTIGVVSELGDDIHFARSGITVFGNAKSEGSIADWKVDDLVLQRAEADLASRHEVVGHVVPHQYDSLIGGNVVPLPAINVHLPFEDMLRSEPRHVDLWVVIAPRCGDGGNYTGPVPCGISIARPEAIFHTPDAWVEVQAAVEVFDSSLKRVASSAVISDRRPCGPFAAPDPLQPWQACAPGVPLGDGYSVDAWQDYTPEQQQHIHSQLLEILGPSIDFTLRRLKLTE